MSDEGAARRPGTFVWVLIAVRFLLELALWSSFTIASVRLIDGPLGWVAGALLTSVSIALWAVLLSPRRPVRLPLVARVAVELALFLVAASLLALTGMATAATVLLGIELLDLALLEGPDKHAL
jgi:hypothetical protein